MINQLHLCSKTHFQGFRIRTFLCSCTAQNHFLCDFLFVGPSRCRCWYRSHVQSSTSLCQSVSVGQSVTDRSVSTFLPKWGKWGTLCKHGLFSTFERRSRQPEIFCTRMLQKISIRNKLKLSYLRKRRCAKNKFYKICTEVGLQLGNMVSKCRIFEVVLEASSSSAS